jgi:hypothetical protein
VKMTTVSVKGELSVCALDGLPKMSGTKRKWQ